MKIRLVRIFGGARARHIRESTKFDVMLILLVKCLHILAVLINQPIHNLGMVVDAIVGSPIIRVSRDQKLVRPELIVVPESSILRKVLNGRSENPADAISSVLIAEFFCAVTMKPHSVEPLGEKIFDSFLAGDIRAFALTVLRDFVVDPRHTYGIIVKWNHS